jgi:hypothetical protein
MRAARELNLVEATRSGRAQSTPYGRRSTGGAAWREIAKKVGRIWREADEGDTDDPTLIRCLLEGQYSNQIAFNTDNVRARWLSILDCVDGGWRAFDAGQ